MDKEGYIYMFVADKIEKRKDNERKGKDEKAI